MIQVLDIEHENGKPHKFLWLKTSEVRLFPDKSTKARIPSQSPVLYSAVTQLFREYVRTQNTPTPRQNTPFPGLILKVGKMNYCLGKVDPKCLKSRQNFSRNGQKIKYASRNVEAFSKGETLGE